MPVLIDSTVISNFASVDRLDLVRVLLQDAYTTAAVQAEVVDGIELGFDFLRGALAHFVSLSISGWIQLVELVEEEQLLFQRLTLEVDVGEASLLAVAAHGGWKLYTDDRRARIFAHRANIEVSGTDRCPG